MYAALGLHLSPEDFDLIQVILHFAIIMVGGIGSLIGSILGSSLIVAVPEVIRHFEWLVGSEEWIFGVAIIAVILFLPCGLSSLLAKLHPIFKDRYYRK